MAVTKIELRETGSEDLGGHAAIPIAFLVDRLLELRPDGGPLDFVTRELPNPWLKDYDAEEGASPALWASRFDTSAWRDLRVAPGSRGLGVGARLVSAAVDWARSRDCRELKVETQNINVGAVRFYESQGFELRSARRGAYPGLPDEIQLLLYRAID